LRDFALKNFPDQKVSARESCKLSIRLNPEKKSGIPTFKSGKPKLWKW